MPTDRTPDRSGSANSVPEAPNQESQPTGGTTAMTAGNASIEAANAVHIPPFWKENPHLWFAQVEAAFAIHRVTSDETKFRYVILYLDHSVLPLVADIIASPPDGDQYKTMKDRLTSVLGETSATRLRKLLTSHELGDDKPSVFLQRLRNLAEGQVSDGVLRTIFMEQLPENVRTILAISEVADLSKLAMQADKILEMTKPTALAIQTVNAESNPLDKMATEIATLTKQMAKLRKQTRSRSRSGDRGRQHYRGRTRSKTRAAIENKICYYHCRFGKEAKKCEEPYDWSSEKKSEN